MMQFIHSRSTLAILMQNPALRKPLTGTPGVALSPSRGIAWGVSHFPNELFEGDVLLNEPAKEKVTGIQPEAANDTNI